MSKLTLLVIFINILCFQLCHSFGNPNGLGMIVDFLKVYEQPTVLVAKVCWEPKNSIKLAKLVHDMERPSNILLFPKDATYNFQKNDHTVFLIDNSCPNVKSFLTKAYENMMFQKPYKWLVIDNSQDDIRRVPNELEDLYISVDSEVIIARRLPNVDYVLHSIYKIKPHSKWNVEYHGIWSSGHGIKRSSTSLISNAMRRKNFERETLTATIVITDDTTKTNLLQLTNITVDTETKFSYRMVNALCDFLNASQRKIYTDTWGYYVNGSWNGMIRDLTRGDADLCGTSTFIQHVRLDVLDYLLQGSQSSMKFVFRRPPLSYQNNLFILPFSTAVWRCLALFTIILIVILYINTKWDSQKLVQYDEKELDETSLIPTWSDMVLFIITAVSQQGSPQGLKGTSGRVVMFVIFLSFVFLYTSYSASIVVLLQSTSNQIKTLSDLLNSKLELGIENMPYSLYYFSPAFARTSDPVRRDIYFTKVAPKGKPKLFDLEDGVKRMQTRPFAFHMNLAVGFRTVSELFQEHEKCGLQEIDYLPNSKPWLCSAKYSPFNDVFKIGYFRILEHGLCHRENRLVFAKKPPCSVQAGSFGSVNMVDFYPVLVLLCLGMVFAFTLLLLEIFVARKLKSRSFSFSRNTIRCSN